MNYNSLKDLKVLLVEDEEKLASLLKSSIGDYFYSFSIANDGKDGVDKFIKVLPDIVISDIMMPKLDGLQMAQKIKKMNPNVPIIILSAFSEKEKLLNAIDVGVVKYFIKPFDPDELLEYLNTLSKNIQSEPLIFNDGFTFNKTKRSLYKEEKYVPLTKREVIFMELLIDNISTITDSELIKETLWKDGKGTDVTLRSFIKRL